MLYPTHKKYGQVYGLLAIPLAVSFGLIPEVNLGDSSSQIVGDAILAMIYMWVAYSAALFGAEFPDIDSPGSIPAQRHPILKMMFKYGGVKHRGKFSHDFTSLGLLFGGMYFLADGVIGGVMKTFLENGVGNSELAPVVAMMGPGGLILSLMKVYILFTLVGAYSHLIADASTKQGVWILWKFPIHIVPVFLTKIEIGGNRPFAKIFNTGTAWEMFNRKLMTYVGLPLGLVISIWGVFTF